MNMFVTGGAGFIGSHLVDLLLDEGHQVTVLALPDDPLENIKSSRVKIIRGDVCDKDLLMKEIKGIDILYHLAARTDLDGKRLIDYQVNLKGTRNVVNAAEKNSVKRLVFFSSMLATSLTGSKEAIDETRMDPAPNVYGESKRVGEAIVLNSEIPCTIIRPTMVYGPRERGAMRAYFHSIRKRRFFLIGSDVWQSFCYVKNLVAACYQASMSPGAVGKSFFISDLKPYTLREFSFQAASAFGVRIFPFSLPYPLGISIAYLFLAIARLTGTKLPLFPSRVKTMTTHYVYSIERARRCFSYTPPYSLNEAMRETTRWYMNQ